MLLQQLGECRLANPPGLARGRQTPPQLESPRRRHVVADRVQELRVVAPQLLTHPVRQPDAFPRQVVAQPRPLAQFDDGRVRRLQPSEAVRVGAQRRGQHARVAAVVLGPGRRQPVAEAVELLRVDRVDREAVFHQALDHRPARRLDRHAYLRRAGGERQQPARHLRETRPAVLEAAFPENLPGSVEDARLARLRAPVDAGEPCQFHLNLFALPSPNPMGANDAGRSLYVLALSGANSPRGVHRWRAAGARVRRRCSWHRATLVAPGSLPKSRRGSTAPAQCGRYRVTRRSPWRGGWRCPEWYFRPSLTGWMTVPRRVCSDT